MPHLTWEQFIDWLAVYQEQPWGEQRADLRAAANTMNGLAPYQKNSPQLPGLEWPYFETDELDVEGTIEALQGLQALIDG